MSEQPTLFPCEDQPPIHPLCPSCGQAFQKKRPGRVQVYCSQACANAHKKPPFVEISADLLEKIPIEFDSFEERKEYTKSLKTQGYNIDQMSFILGISRATIWKILSERNHLPVPRKRLADIPTYETDGASERTTSLALGTANELVVAAKLLTLGFDVWKPVMDRHRSDLGVFRDGRIMRVQAKLAGYDHKSKRYRSALTSKKRGKTVRYSDSEFEFFIVRCAGLEEYYIIPSSVGNKVGYANLYPHRKRIRFGDVSLEKYRNDFDLLR